MRPLILTALLISSTGLASEKLDQPLRQGLTWDAEAEVGFAVVGVDGLTDRFLFRGRAGLLIAREPWFTAVGATFEASGPPELAGGLQVSLSHLWSGFWIDGGVSLNRTPDLFLHVGGGYALFGLEWMHQLTGDPAAGDDRNALLVKLRIPIGIFFFAY